MRWANKCGELERLNRQGKSYLLQLKAKVNEQAKANMSTSKINSLTAK